MTASSTVLLIGTLDTKSDEAAFLRDTLAAQGARPLLMDVSVLGRGALTPDFANTEVAAAAGLTLQQVIDSGDENTSMQAMARGAALLAAQLQAQRRIDGVLVFGGTMGTDLALDVTQALPLGFPKVLLSTIAHSPLLPPQRIAPDLITVLWAGGLHGLNDLCRSALAQAAGAVVGACRAAVPPRANRPLVGMTSLGSSALAYMKALQPELDRRGYELAVFHTTGMGGRAFEALAEQGRFVAVMDFSLQELMNHIGDSCVSAGPDRLCGAGRAGVPQIVAPGATDMVDYPAWQEAPERFAGRPMHAHNRLIASACIGADLRRQVARAICQRLAQARGPTALIVPTHGIEGWDRPGEPLHDPQALAVLVDELRRGAPKEIELVMLDAHINDRAFVDAALAVFDRWVEQGRIVRSAPEANAAAPRAKGVA